MPSDDCPLSAADIAHWLDEHDIAVRVGHHCAQPLVDSLGVTAALRISLAGYSTQADILRLCEALQSLPLDGAASSSRMVLIEPVALDIFNLDPLDELQLDELANQGWQQRYRRLMKWGDKLVAKPTIHQPQHLVKGCESAAWLVHHCIDGRHEFAIDSDARVVRGLSVLLLLLVQGRLSHEITRAGLETVFTELGLDKHLSVSRSNGFRALVDAVLKAVNAEG